MDDGTLLIAVEHLHMRYPVPRRLRHYLLHPFSNTERAPALIDVSLSVEKGDRIAFLGPNGAGKTSLLKLIGGLILPTSGRILFKKRDAVQNPAELRRAVGLVLSEERSFYWRLTGRQNLVFFGTLDNLEPKILDRRIAELSAAVGLEGQLDKRVASFSSGMRQRLAIVRSLLADPQVLILDEPTRTLDPVAAEEHVDFLVERIHSDLNKTLLVASHKLQEASRLCDRYCIIHRGRLTAQTDAKQLQDRAESLEQFYRAAVA